MTEQDSSITRRQLGRYLREAREAVGLTIEEAARLMEWGKSSLQRIETGRNQKVRIRDLDGLIEIYGIDDDRAAGLRGLAQQAAEKSWWHEYGGVIPDNFSVYMGMESAARILVSYQPDLVPGLLQTRDYARVLVRNAFPDETEEEITSRVEPRMLRQKLITRNVQPSHLEIVLGETALCRVIGGRKTMAAQLKHLADASTRPNISIRLLPFTAGMPTGDQIGPFVILDFGADRPGKQAEPTVVYAENYTSDMYSEKLGIVGRYRRAHEALRRAALDEVASRNMLRIKAREYLACT